MASRVNTKFVAVLAVVLTLVCGAVVAVGWMTLRKGPEELAALGDKYAAEGDWEKAADMYSRAVFKDQTNPELLKLWVGAVEQIVPETPQQYVDMYFWTYLPALRSLAEAGRTDAALHRRYLEEHLRRLTRFGSTLRGWEDMLATAEGSLRTYGASTPGAEGVARYRGLARLGIYALGAQIPPEQYEQAAKDLEGAVAADPSDGRAATALSELYRLRAQRLRLDREDREADGYVDRARGVLGAFLQENPGSVEALVELVRLESAETLRRAGGPMTYAQLAAQHTELFERMVAAAREAAPGSLRPTVVSMAVAAVLPLPQYGRDVAMEIVDRAMGPGGRSAMLLMEKADIELRVGRREESIALLQRVIELEDLPMSLDGLALHDQRTRAAAKQIDAVLAGWDAAASAGERGAVLKRAREHRDALAARVGGDRPELDLIDAKLRYAAGEFDAARTLLTRYNEKRGSTDAHALILLGDILQRQGSMGGARAQYERAAELRPNDVRVLMALAGVDVALRDYDGAVSRLRRATQLDPSNDAAAEQLRVAQDLQRGEATDPIVAALLEVQRLTSGLTPDGPAAAAHLRAAIAQHGQEPRLVRVLGQLLASMGERAGALEAVRAGLEANPGNAVLAALAKQLEVEDPMEAALRSIDASEAPAISKHLMRYEVHARAGDADKAAAALSAARALDADAPAVLEADFSAALTAGDRAAARALAERAAARNADNVGGLSFRARVAFLEEKFEDAASFLRQATERDPLNPLLWRYLGETRAVLKQHDRAAEAFAKALEVRPGDVPSARGLVRARFAAGRVGEALAAARAAAQTPTAAADPEFVEIWVTLESTAPGGDRERALAARRELAERSPENRRNLAALAELLMARGELQEARGLIAALRADRDDLQAVELDARWQIAGGNPQGAVDVFAAYIGSIKPEERTDAPHIALARLLANSGQPEAASQVLEQSRPVQDKKVMGVDRELAELHFRYGQYERALELLRGIVAAGAEDTGSLLARGIAECLLRLERFDEAERSLAQLGAEADREAGLVAMRARAAAGRGDRARARTLLDRAISLEPANPAWFFARAEFLAQDPALAADAEADMRQVLRLDQRYPGARQWLARWAMNAGRWEQAIDHLRAAVTEDPDDDETRRQLIGVLLMRQRGAEAIEQLNAALARKPEAVHWLLASAEVHGRAGVPERSAPHLERAWRLSKSPEVATAYVLSLLAQRPPNTAAAAQVLATPELGTDRSLPLLLMRSRVRAAAGQAEASRADLEAAYRGTDPRSQEQVGVFFSATMGTIPDAASRMRLLDSLARVKPLTDWFLLNYALVRQDAPDGLSGLDEVVRPLTEHPEDANLAMMAMQVLGQVYIAQGRPEEAAGMFKRLLDIVPDDPNTNNNYAYVVGRMLGRTAEALPHAEKAVRLMPQSSGALHTLGVVLLKAGRLPEAEGVLTRAVGAAATPQERIPVHLAMADLRLAQNNRPDAERSLSLAQEAMEGAPMVRGRYEAELRELKSKIGAR